METGSADARGAPYCQVRSSRPLLCDALAPLLRAHPGSSLRLFLHDEQIDLLAQRIDLAIRVGEREDSSLVARPIADWRLLLCCAPAHVARCGALQEPRQLSAVEWICLNAERPGQGSLCTPGGQVRRVRLEGRIQCNNILSVRQFTLAGMGVSLPPEPEIRKQLASGQLLALLPQWQAPPSRLHIVTPRGDVQPAKVRYAIEALRRHLVSV